MNALGWNPARELEEVSDRLNRVLTRGARGRNENEAMTVADWIPLVAISEIGRAHV